MNSTFETVRQAVAEALLMDPQAITPETLLLDLPNIDSLSFEMIIAALEQACGHDIAATDLLDLKTVADLEKLVA